MAAHDDEADGEGYGEDESDGSPDECPESGSDEDGDGREPGVAAVDVGLGVVGGDDFEDAEDGEDEDGVFPAVEDGDGEERGGESGDGRSDVGDEAAEGGERSKQEGVRESDEVEGDAYEGAVGDVDGDLEEEIARDAAGGIAHGLGHEGEVAVAGETDEAVAEVFSLQEYEEGEDDGEEGGGEGFKDAAELIETAGGATDFADLQRVFGRGADGLLSGFAGRLESGGGSRVDDAEFIAEFLECALDAADGGVAGAMESVELLGDVVAIDGKFVGDGDELGKECPRGDEEERGEGKDNENGGGRTREPDAFEESDDRGEEEGEKDCDSERQEQDLG